MKRRNQTLHDLLEILYAAIELIAILMSLFVRSYVAMVLVSIAFFTAYFCSRGHE